MCASPSMFESSRGADVLLRCGTPPPKDDGEKQQRGPANDADGSGTELGPSEEIA